MSLLLRFQQFSPTVVPPRPVLSSTDLAAVGKEITVRVSCNG